VEAITKGLSRGSALIMVTGSLPCPREPKRRVRITPRIPFYQISLPRASLWSVVLVAMAHRRSWSPRSQFPFLILTFFYVLRSTPVFPIGDVDKPYLFLTPVPTSVLSPVKRQGKSE
jgi:hypothetical protein